MTESGRRELLRGAVVAGSVLVGGCLGQSPGTDERSATPSRTTTTTSSTPQTPNVADPHPVSLEVENATANALRVRVVVRLNGETERDETREVPSKGSVAIAEVYPVSTEESRVYETVLSVGGKEVGRRRVNVFDYHHLHRITARILGDSVDWSRVVH